MKKPDMENQTRRRFFAVLIKSYTLYLEKINFLDYTLLFLLLFFSAGVKMLIYCHRTNAASDLLKTSNRTNAFAPFCPHPLLPSMKTNALVFWPVPNEFFHSRQCNAPTIRHQTRIQKANPTTHPYPRARQIFSTSPDFHYL
jgi:hypothetical protein